MEEERSGKAGRLLALLAKHIRLYPEQDGVYVKGHCPFHKDGKEVTPAFSLYVGHTKPETAAERGKRFGGAYCFVCGRGWSPKGLLRGLGLTTGIREIMDELDLAEAEDRVEGRRARLRERIRARQHGADEPTEPPERRPLPESFLGLFDNEDPDGQMASLGFTEETLRKFEIGYDKAARRIVFPIRDPNGRLIGASGRNPGSGQGPRYHNYSSEIERNYPWFGKANKGVLWGAHLWRDKRNQRGGQTAPLVLLEGYKAAMWVHQESGRDVIAMMGVRLEPAHIEGLGRMASSLVLFLDNDPAGVKATLRFAQVLQSAGFSVCMANYGSVHPDSPDDLNRDRVLHAVQNTLGMRAWLERYGRFLCGDGDEKCSTSRTRRDWSGVVV